MATAYSIGDLVLVNIGSKPLLEGEIDGFRGSDRIRIRIKTTNEIKTVPRECVMGLCITWEISQEEEEPPIMKQSSRATRSRKNVVVSQQRKKAAGEDDDQHSDLELDQPLYALSLLPVGCRVLVKDGRKSGDRHEAVISQHFSKDEVKVKWTNAGYNQIISIGQIRAIVEEIESDNDDNTRRSKRRRVETQRFVDLTEEGKAYVPVIKKEAHVIQEQPEPTPVISSEVKERVMKRPATRVTRNKKNTTHREKAPAKVKKKKRYTVAASADVASVAQHGRNDDAVAAAGDDSNCLSDVELDEPLYALSVLPVGCRVLVKDGRKSGDRQEAVISKHVSEDEVKIRWTNAGYNQVIAIGQIRSIVKEIESENDDGSTRRSKRRRVETQRFIDLTEEGNKYVPVIKKEAHAKQEEPQAVATHASATDGLETPLSYETYNSDVTFDYPLQTSDPYGIKHIIQNIDFVSPNSNSRVNSVQDYMSDLLSQRFHEDSSDEGSDEQELHPAIQPALTLETANAGFSDQEHRDEIRFTPLLDPQEFSDKRQSDDGVNRSMETASPESFCMLMKDLAPPMTADQTRSAEKPELSQLLLFDEELHGLAFFDAQCRETRAVATV